ncbi:hypothetical protein ADUPG1_004140, partial [Aduncisulcus paluster]
MQFKAQFDQILGITAPPEPTTKPKTWDDMPPGKPVLNSYSNPPPKPTPTKVMYQHEPRKAPNEYFRQSSAPQHASYSSAPSSQASKGPKPP